MKSEMMRLRTFDLFCGAGGSSRGAVMAGATPVAALDMWELASETYALNFPRATIYTMKARSMASKRLQEEVGKIDLLLASPECTNHSIARGKRPRCEDSRNSAFEVIRFARAMRPRFVIVENVLQMRHWGRYAEFLRKLQRLGYNTEDGILDSQYYDTPQARRRLFIVADLERQPTLPDPGPLTSRTVESILGTGECNGKPWAYSPVNSPSRAEATVERAQRAAETLGDVPYIMCYYGSDYAGGFQTIDRPLRTVTTLDRFAHVRPNCQGMEMRMLQPPELAAAMGFPLEHNWPNSTRREKIKLIGNAVCPLVMRNVVEHLCMAD